MSPDKLDQSGRNILPNARACSLSAFLEIAHKFRSSRQLTAFSCWFSFVPAAISPKHVHYFIIIISISILSAWVVLTAFWCQPKPAFNLMLVFNESIHAGVYFQISLTVICAVVSCLYINYRYSVYHLFRLVCLNDSKALTIAHYTHNWSISDWWFVINDWSPIAFMWFPSEKTLNKLKASKISK